MEKIFMDNYKDKNRESRDHSKDAVKNNLEGSKNVSAEDVIANQGSEEQKMKEKYISEISKIEDAPGNGGVEKKDDSENISNDD
jgi:hypothetical protein